MSSDSVLPSAAVIGGESLKCSEPTSKAGKESGPLPKFAWGPRGKARGEGSVQARHFNDNENK